MGNCLRFSKLWRITLAAALLAAGINIVRAEHLAKITVKAGNHLRIDTPVSMSLAGIPRGVTLELLEIKEDKKIPVPSQIEQAIPGKLWWILSGQTLPGQTRVFELIEGKTVKSPGIKVKLDGKALLIKQADARILQYNYAIVPPPPGVNKLYNRSGFIHPLWSPDQDILTNIHPKDHYHHVGIWMPWEHTKFEGKDVDFWNLGKGQGTVRFVQFLSIDSGPVFGGFRAQQHHVALKTSTGEKVVLNEVWNVKAFNVGGPKKGYWLIDFISTQRCVADTPLYQLKYRYGGFGYRAAKEWNEGTAEYLTSEGKTRKNGHATRARWCDAYGKIGNNWSGITFMSHPDNFRYPEPMRIWPSGQVFFNWAPSQLGDWVMKPGEDHVFHYRMYVHEGKVDRAASERFWNDFGNPPQVIIER